MRKTHLLRTLRHLLKKIADCFRREFYAYYTILSAAAKGVNFSRLQAMPGSDRRLRKSCDRNGVPFIRYSRPLVVPTATATERDFVYERYIT